MPDTRKSDCGNTSRAFLVRRKQFDPINDGNPLPYFDRTRTVIVFEQYKCGVPQVGIQCDCHSGGGLISKYHQNQEDKASKACWFSKEEMNVH